VISRRFLKICKKSIVDAVEKSKRNTAIILNIALNYGGRNEIIRAINKLMNENAPITEEALGTALDTSYLPDPDIIIRTGGAQRISNFLLWQCCYAEFYFTNTLWPDYNPQEFQKTLTIFENRERRFGR
jgi:undecaprenyl diphosphate synthase